MWPYALAGLGLGYLQHKGNKAEADKQRNFESVKEAMSPWTGQHGNYVANPNAMGTMIQGGLTGAQFGQGMQNAEAQNAFMGAMQQKYLYDAGQGGNMAAAPQQPMGSAWDKYYTQNSPQYSLNS